MLSKNSAPANILRFSHRFERFIVFVLLILLMLIILLGTCGLIWMMIETLHQKVVITGFTDVNFAMPLLHDIFAGFLMILIGLELMKTVVMYLDEHVVHVEVVLSVALIAIARHVIDLDLEKVPALNLIGIGAVIFALAIGYFYFKRSSPREPTVAGFDGDTDQE